MDITDILGGLPGKGPDGAGSGGSDIFGDILARAGQAKKTGQATGGTGGSQPSSRSTAAPRSTSPDDHMGRMARELEDFLGVGRGPQPPATPRPPQAPAVPHAPAAPPRPSVPTGPTSSLSDRSQILVRAMVNSAKADGRITPDEQQKILGQLGSAASEAMQFLRDELARPLDVREFAWSVPLGMEQEVYAMSVLSVTVDSPAETEYLDQLAHGLRLVPDVRTQLEQRFGSAGRRGP
jgi:hypothetical protein